MSYLKRIILLAYSVFAFTGGVMAATFALSEAEANQRVASEVVEKASHEASLKTKIESVTARAEWETDLGDRKIVLRRVAPQLIKSKKVAN